VKAIVDEFAVTEVDARRDLTAFLRELDAEGLLATAEAAGGQGA
jgi:hypothetical protein